jgi:hypothetical protein
MFQNLLQTYIKKQHFIPAFWARFLFITILNSDFFLLKKIRIFCSLTTSFLSTFVVSLSVADSYSLEPN